MTPSAWSYLAVTLGCCFYTNFVCHTSEQLGVSKIWVKKRLTKCLSGWKWRDLSFLFAPSVTAYYSCMTFRGSNHTTGLLCQWALLNQKRLPEEKIISPKDMYNGVSHVYYKIWEPYINYALWFSSNFCSSHYKINYS